jgi:hypothetical protein
MASSKAQRYERLSKRAGITGSVCLIIWIASMFGAAVLTQISWIHALFERFLSELRCNRLSGRQPIFEQAQVET